MKKNNILLLSCILLLLCSQVGGQTTQEDQAIRERDRLQEDETRQELEKINKELVFPKKNFSVKFGGWVSSYFSDYHNVDNDKDAEETVSNRWLYEVRLWAKMLFFNKHSAYMRIKDSYTTRKASSVLYTGIGDDYDGPKLDMAYAQTKLSLKDHPLSLTAGRQYLYIGRGIAYRDVHDGIKITLETPRFFYKGFASHTLPDEDNIDTSLPEYDKKGDRAFYGLEAGYLGFPQGALYGYYLFQKDLAPDHFPGDGQTYNYDSQYIGCGFEGTLGEIGYAGEIIREKGKSYNDSTQNPTNNDINAWAYMVNANYIFKTITHPFVELEYALGSGDPDRSDVVETKAGGNVYGDDKNFLYFGTYYAGYALSPRLSNMQIYKAHLALTPFEKFKIGEKIIFGVKYFFYRKDRAEGGIYDSDATNPYKDIGQEINGYLYWNLTPRLSWSFRYGVFYPGKAYHPEINSNTKYLSTQLTYKF